MSRALTRRSFLRSMAAAVLLAAAPALPRFGGLGNPLLSGSVGRYEHFLFLDHEALRQWQRALNRAYSYRVDKLLSEFSDSALVVTLYRDDLTAATRENRDHE